MAAKDTKILTKTGQGRKKGTKKTGGRDFKKGVSGNPKGRPPVPKEVRMAMQLTRTTVRDCFAKYMNMTIGEIADQKKNPHATMTERLIIAIMLKGIKEGNIQCMDFILNRTIGKVKDEIAVDVNSTHSKIVEYIEIMTNKK